MSKTADYTNEEILLKFVVGDDLLAPIFFTDTTTGAAIDISSWAFDAGITDESGAEVTAITCTTPVGTDGELRLSLTDTQTAALPVNGRNIPNLWWWCSVTISGFTQTYFKGRLQVSIR